MGGGRERSDGKVGHGVGPVGWRVAPPRYPVSPPPTHHPAAGGWRLSIGTFTHSTAGLVDVSVCLAATGACVRAFFVSRPRSTTNRQRK